jgi:pyroglutamyl-peptidase
MAGQDHKGRRVLVTGFGPFPGQPVNPSAELAGRLAAVFGGCAGFRAAILPTEYRAGRAKLAAEIADFRPDIVICFGVAAAAEQVRIESRACIRAHPARKDAAGLLPEDIAPGPEHLHSALDLEALAADMWAGGAAAGISADAGDYLCNFIYYTALREGAGRYDAVFVHIPDPALPGRPEMARLARGAQALVRRFL